MSNPTPKFLYTDTKIFECNHHGLTEFFENPSLEPGNYFCVKCHDDMMRLLRENQKQAMRAAGYIVEDVEFISRVLDSNDSENS